MSADALAQRGAVFIGSLPYATASDAFVSVGNALGNYLKYIPDGETGERFNFVGWQIAKYPKQLLHASMGGDESAPLSKAQAEELLGNHQTDYDTAAIESYAVFKKLRNEQKIPRHLKMAVCVPTAMNCMGAIAFMHRKAVEPYVEAALKRALRNIQDSIPREDLAIQIDCSAEFAVLDRDSGGLEKQYAIFSPFWDGDVNAGVHERLVRALSCVDEDTVLNLHLCYGDYDREHHCSPRSETLVSVMETVLSKSGRRIGYLHMPVPTDAGEEYFRPLLDVKELLAKNDTTLYLGFIYPGEYDGNKERVAMARKVLGDLQFGVASYCGLGRQQPEVMERIFEEIKALSSPIVE